MRNAHMIDPAREANTGTAGVMLALQEEERRRVSRELHDDLGQRLALLEIRIDRMKQQAGANLQMASELGSLQGNVAEIADDVHRICHSLHPAVLENCGLVAGLESFCDEFERWSGVESRFVHRSVTSQVPIGTSLCLYRVVQEALHNVAKHSGAKRADVSLRGLAGGLQVVIEDAGQGFELARTEGRHGLGVVSIGERARLAGGRCTIRSAPGRGTRITVWVPLERRRETCLALPERHSRIIRNRRLNG